MNQPQIIDYQGQQGDVLLTRVKGLPAGCEEIKKENGPSVLAHGEVTGYKHRFESANVRIFSSNDNNIMRRFVVIEREPAILFHEEHKEHTYAPGVYEVKIAREWQ